MEATHKIQKKRRFWLYFILIPISILISFWSGYRLGREVEKQDWLKIINPSVIKMPQSS